MPPGMPPGMMGPPGAPPFPPNGAAPGMAPPGVGAPGAFPPGSVLNVFFLVFETDDHKQACLRFLQAAHRLVATAHPSPKAVTSLQVKGHQVEISMALRMDHQTAFLFLKALRKVLNSLVQMDRQVAYTLIG